MSSAVCQSRSATPAPAAPLPNSLPPPCKQAPGDQPPLCKPALGDLRACAKAEALADDRLRALAQRERPTPAQEALEPLLKANPHRHVLFPVEHPDLYRLYDKSLSCFWRPEEIQLTQDLKDWHHKLNADERHFLSHVLAFFAASDGIVMENLAVRFFGDVQLAEARAFYATQICMENIHSHVYSTLIEAYVTDLPERTKLFHAVQEFPCIRAKAAWAQQWIERADASFAERLLAFACVEGIFFSGAFCSIFWMKKRGLLPGLCFSNELISRDEALHCEFAVMLYHKLQHRLSTELVHAMVHQALLIEETFIGEALPCRLIGMNADLMCQYIRFVADRLLVQLGYPRLYQAQNPFEFMELISMESKTNFFEKRVDAYALADLTAPAESDFGPTDDADF